MSILKSILLGLVQAITEFIPVSSSGHLTVLQLLMGINIGTGVSFEVFMHLATLISVIIVFRKDLHKLFVELIQIIIDIRHNVILLFYNRKTKAGRRYLKILNGNYKVYVVLVLLSTLVTCITGLLLRTVVVQAQESYIVTGIGFLTTAILLLVVDIMPPGKKLPKDLKWYYAIILGFCQGLGVLPGISRCAVVITVAILLGCSRRFAIRLSYIMSIPAILGACALELPKVMYDTLTTMDVACVLIGGAVACFGAFFFIYNLLHMLERCSFRKISIYCFIIGALTIAANYILL